MGYYLGIISKKFNNTLIMKHFFITIFLIISIFTNAYSQSNTDLLYNFQTKVDSLYQIHDPNECISQLEDLYLKINKIQPANNIVNYWQAYVYFMISTKYLEISQYNKSKQFCDEAIKILKGVKGDDSEILALLAYMQGFSISFVKGMEAGIISKEANKNSKSAIKLSHQNPRAYYVAGMLDYYTPKEYGGQMACEEYLKKAISLIEPNRNNPYLPTWGKEDAYIILISYYKSLKLDDKAKELYNEAIRLFPESKALKNF